MWLWNLRDPLGWSQTGFSQIGSTAPGSSGNRSGGASGRAPARPRSVWARGRAAVAVAMLLVLAAGAAAPTAASAESSLVSAVRGSTSGTEVELAEGLRELFAHGGVPESLEQLRLLERQQRRVAAAASDCTVSVQIGPAQGCGVIVTETGYVLTAAHVAMRPGKAASVMLSDGRKVSATTLGMNRKVDAGLIKIDEDQNEGEPWPHATLGSSDNLEAGMWCVATGHPGGYDSGRGPVTRVGRILAVRPGALVTDCALIGGDSGGPLFDLEGRLIAVHSRIGNDVADNLHVPVDHYDRSWERLVASESWGFLPGFRPVLGVSGNKSASVARVLRVADGSPADQAGLEPDDVVEQFGDISITDFQSLKEAVADTMPGERVKVWLDRDGTRLQVTVEIGREQ